MKLSLSLVICASNCSATSTTTTTTTTSKPVHPDQFLEVFVLIVNEQDFVMNNNSEKFRDAVWKIFTE